MLKISVVSYSNSVPFVYGLQESVYSESFQLSLDHPADCARKLAENQVDIGLVPVALLKDFPQLKIHSNFCIGTLGKVDTVKLYANEPLQEIKKVWLDYQSMSSVNLCKILFQHHWNLEPEFADAEPGYENGLGKQEAMVIIGDRCFDTNGAYNYEYDLAEVWKEFTGLPFVFAVWAGKPDLNPELLEKFQKSLSFGLENRQSALEKFIPQEKQERTSNYWQDRIHFHLNDEMEKAYTKFLSLI